MVPIDWRRSLSEVEFLPLLTYGKANRELFFTFLHGFGRALRNFLSLLTYGHVRAVEHFVDGLIFTLLYGYYSA